VRFPCDISVGAISRDGAGSDQMATLDKANTRLLEGRCQALALQLQSQLFRRRCRTPYIDINVHLAWPWNTAKCNFLEKETVCQLHDLCLRTTLPFDRTQFAT